jgi:hypothetical protein
LIDFVDSGFLDEKLFRVFVELGIGYICGGKLYGEVKAYVASLYTMLIAFFLCDTFKEDVCPPVIEVRPSTTTATIKVIDIAAKLAQHADKILLGGAEATWGALNVAELWQ